MDDEQIGYQIIFQIKANRLLLNNNILSKEGVMIYL